jgi:hypothetical protein
LEQAVAQANMAADRACVAKREVEHRLQALTEEFHTQEMELTAAASQRRQHEDRAHQVEVLAQDVVRLQGELAAAAEANAAAQLAVGERNRMRSKSETQNKQMLEQLERVHALEQALEESQQALDDLQEERDILMAEFGQMVDSLKSQGVSVQFEAGQLSEENKELRVHVRGLEASLASKEAAVARLKTQLDDQTLLVQSMHADRSAASTGEDGQPSFGGSLMNEIEHMVMAQIQATDAFSSEDEETAEPTPEPALAPAPAPAPAKPMVLVPAAELAALMTEPIAGTPPPQLRSSSMSPVRRAGRRGAGASADIGAAGSPSVSRTLSRRPSISGSKRSVQDRLQVYAAMSASHLAGRKIITSKMAMDMDMPTLRRTAAALQDLIDTRSTRLIDALAEREWLQNDIELKQTFAKFYLDAAKKQVEVAAAQKPAKSTSMFSSPFKSKATPVRPGAARHRSRSPPTPMAAASTPLSRFKFWGSATPTTPAKPTSSSPPR